MALDQQTLVAALTEAMNDCMTSWIVYGPYEVRYIVERLLGDITLLAGSIARADGFAQSSDGAVHWIFVDADGGSAAFIIPRDERGESVDRLREQILALQGGLRVTPCIYGNVNDDVWHTLGGAGRRVAVPAQEFLA